MADSPLLALTVRPPWSIAIAMGQKTAENRKWATRHRGLVAIHSAVTVAPDAFSFPPLARLWTPGTRFHKGCVVAVATLADCHPAGPCEARNGPGMCSEWAMPGYAFHWLLEDAIALPEPVPATGRERLWPLPGDAEKAVRVQLEVPGATARR